MDALPLPDQIIGGSRLRRWARRRAAGTCRNLGGPGQLSGNNFASLSVGGERCEVKACREPAVGIEPTTCRLQGGCSGQLSYTGGAGTKRGRKPLRFSQPVSLEERRRLRIAVSAEIAPRIGFLRRPGRARAGLLGRAVRTGSGGDGQRWVAGALAVSVSGERVDAEGMGELVEVLALVADAVGSAEPQGVVEGPVDGLGVVAAPVERLEVRVRRGDGRMFSVRLNRRRVSSVLPWGRMLMLPPPRWSGSW